MLPDAIHATRSPVALRPSHDAFLQQRGGLHQVYEGYRNHLMLAQRRSGSRVLYRGAPVKDIDVPPLPVYSAIEDDANEVAIQNELAARQEEEHGALHAARLCAQLHTLRNALTQSNNTQQQQQSSPTVSHHRSPVDDGASGARVGSPQSAAMGGRTNRTNSVASATELMELFRTDQLNPDAAPAGLVRAEPYVAPHHPHRVHVVVPPLLTSTSSSSTTQGGCPLGGASSDCSAIPPASLRSKSTTSPMPHYAGRRRSSGTIPALPARSHRRPPLSSFARRRIGQLLADVVIACASISEGARLENVEDLLCDVPVLVLSQPSIEDGGSSSSRGRAGGVGTVASCGINGKFSPLGAADDDHGAAATAASNIQHMVKTARSFFHPSVHDRHRGHERNLSEGDESSAPPFLNFDVVNSAEDLTMFEDEYSEWGSGSREQPQMQHHVNRRQQNLSGGYQVPHSHHQSHAGSPSSNPQQQQQQQHYSLPPAANSSHHSLLSPQGNSTSHRQLMAGLSMYHPRSMSTAGHRSFVRQVGDHPHSPNSSVLFRPALSFTSVESPRNRRPPSGSPQGLHFSLSPPPGVSYTVDESRLHVFLKSLHDIAGLVSDKRVSPREFTEFGLRYTVPGVFSMLGSLAPTPQHGALFVPPALSGLFHDAIFLPAPTVEPRQTDPFGLPPKPQSQEALDHMSGAIAGASNGQVSRMSSFRATAASPTAESIPIVENGHQRIVTLNEFPIFLAAVKKTLIDVDSATGKVYNLCELFESTV
jgi:hypothetical protein